jgi:hypothetical protein
MLTKMSRSRRRLEPPGGDAPPASVLLEDADQELELVPLAEETCRRYRQEFPDEQGRYGDAGNAWCVHDLQYLLYWAAEDVNGYLDIRTEVAWLGSVLEARDFPLERFARASTSPLRWSPNGSTRHSVSSWRGRWPARPYSSKHAQPSCRAASHPTSRLVGW